MQTESTEASSSKRYATSEDWARFQNVIVRLYVEENKTLDEVKQHLEENHGFVATIAMYKRQLASWNAYKNLRFDEVLQILRLKRQRDAERKPSTFYVRDRKVDVDSLQVYISRNPALHAKLESGEAPHSDAVRDVSCHSPQSADDRGDGSQGAARGRETALSATPKPEPLSHDDLLRTLRGYLCGSFESGAWLKSQLQRWSARDQRGPAELLKSLLDRCVTAALAVGRQVEPVAIRHALDVPFTLLIRVFRNPPPDLIPRTLCVASRLEFVGRKEIQTILMQFCYDLSIAVFQRDHPLTNFWKALLDIPAAERRIAIDSILACCVSIFDEHLGADHSLSTEVFLLYFDAVERHRDPVSQLESLRRQLAKVDEQNIDPSVLGMVKLEHALATCKLRIAENRLDEAEDVLIKLDGPTLSPRDESFRCVWLGYIRLVKGDVAVAKKAYQDSVEAAKRTGSRDCVSEALFQLETFYLHTQDPLRAERIRAERLDVLRQLDSIIWTEERSPIPPKAIEGRSEVTVIRIGSDAHSREWRPSAFDYMMEHHRIHINEISAGV
ncbi:hypothetical protein F5Y18DRAFT_363361 [Xylariaceae sp. FL1019]|nr:hypothetical protein F5Y18DRAFT_363361 [Xylariaceae sp. FL1019]